MELLINDATDPLQPCSLQEIGRLEEGVNDRGERKEELDR